MPAVENVLIVGGGSAGNALAILLRRGGVTVELVDADPEWGALGSGITLCGNFLRVLDQLGVYEQARAQFVPFPPEMDIFKTGGPDYPGVAGMSRRALQGVLRDAVLESGATVRLGVRPTALKEVGDHVEVSFDDGSKGEFDLVVGADGVASAVRGLVGIDVHPQRLGLSIWRVYVPRPAGQMLEGGHGDPYPVYGVNPVSENHMYAYVVEPARDADEVRALDPVAEVKRLGQALKDPFRAAFDSVTRADQVDWRPFHALDLGEDCFRGRTVLIGDAAHVCPPTLAQGAAMAVEDAAVLAEFLLGTDKLDEDLLAEYAARRAPRVSAVVQTSVDVCESALDPASDTAALWFERNLQLTPMLAELP
ncbi:FAD-dependent monooxygenase [Streptomyces sp. YKOK-I1]